MSEYKWNADAFDAIRIVAANGEFEFEGNDTNEILLEGEDDGRRRFGGEPAIAGRWLTLRPFGGGSEWSISLPRSKAWVIELSSGNGEVQVQDLDARLTVQLGHGEIHVENCRGVFNLKSGSGDVTMENCVQREAPQAPEYVAPKQSKTAPSGPGGLPPIPPTPGIPPIPPIPPVGIKMRMGKGIRMTDPDNWEEYGQQWEDWGEQFGEQVSQWAENFSRNFSFDFKFGDEPDESTEDGVHIRLGHGDIQLEEVDAQLVTARLGSGDIQVESGRIAELDAETMRGDLQISSALPTATWNLATRHGDIELTLPGDAYARLDAATRHGDIECDAPLVRVGRPGPGARHGGRMVGTVGEGQGEPVEIHIESQHGDIQINAERRASRYAGQAAVRTERSPQSSDSTPRAEQSIVRSAQPAGASSDVPMGDAGTPPSQDAPKSSAARKGGYDSQMAILQALQKGEVSVAEAETLLRSLKD